MPTDREGQPDPRSKWNYHPELPLADKSIFGWPPDVGFLVRWFGTFHDGSDEATRVIRERKQRKHAG